MKGCNEIENPCAKGFVCVNGGRCEQSCKIDQHCMEGRYVHATYVKHLKYINVNDTACLILGVTEPEG